jgi:hypothetical protein
MTRRVFEKSRLKYGPAHVFVEINALPLPWKNVAQKCALLLPFKKVQSKPSPN